MSWFKSKRTASKAAADVALKLQITGRQPSLWQLEGRAITSVTGVVFAHRAYCPDGCKQFHALAESGFDKMPEKKLTPYSPSTNFNVDYI